MANGRVGDVHATGADLSSSIPWPAWLRDWIRPVDTHAPLAWPFDGPSWLRDWLKPIEPATHATDSAQASWLDRLRNLFAPEIGMVCRRS